MQSSNDETNRLKWNEWFPELNPIQWKMLKQMLYDMIGPDLDYRGNSPEVMVNEFKAKLRKEIEEA